MKQVKKIFSLIIFLSCFFMVQMAFAQEVIVTGFGMNRDDAIRDAMRLGVEQAVGSVIDATTITQNYQLLQDDIYSKSVGYVQSYKILREGKTDQDYFVKASVVVDTSPNSPFVNKLQQVVALKDPRIAVIIKDDYHSPDEVAQGAVVNALQEYGFSRIMDFDSIASKSESSYVSLYNLSDVMETAKNIGVDYLVVGTVISDVNRNPYSKYMDQGISSYHAVIEAKLYKAATGEIITTYNTDGMAADTSDSRGTANAKQQAGKKLGEYISAKFAVKKNNNFQLKVYVSSFEKLQTVRSALSQVYGVRNIYDRAYNQGVAIIDCEYSASEKALVTNLKKAGLDFEVLSSGQGNLAIQVY